jgi:hypothetical protein
LITIAVAPPPAAIGPALPIRAGLSLARVEGNRPMIDRHARRRVTRGAWLAAALALTLAGCAQSGAGYGSSSPAAYGSSDPYHYRCTGNCQAGG